MIETPIPPATLRVEIRARFLNGARLTKSYTGCRDIAHALDRFDRDARQPINLGQYDVTGLTFGLETTGASK